MIYRWIYASLEKYEESRSKKKNEANPNMIIEIIYLITSRVMLRTLKLSGSRRKFCLSVIEMRKMHITKKASCDTKSPLFFPSFSYPESFSVLFFSFTVNGINKVYGGRYLTNARIFF